MRITAAHRKAINEFARSIAGRDFLTCDVAERYALCSHPEHTTLNERFNLVGFGTCESDLNDTVHLRDFRQVEGDGAAVLDVYLYIRGEGYRGIVDGRYRWIPGSRELYSNFTVGIASDGTLTCSEEHYTRFIEQHTEPLASIIATIVAEGI